MDIIKGINRIQRLGSSAGAQGSLAITIPAEIVRRLSIEKGEQFEVEWTAGAPALIMLTRVSGDAPIVEGDDE